MSIADTRKAARAGSSPVEDAAPGLDPGARVARRQVLRAGGLAGLAGLAAACTSFGFGDDEAGGTGDGNGEQVTADADADIAFLRTAASLAIYGVRLYEAVLEAADAGALRLDGDLRDAITSFRADHRAHGDAFSASAVTAGGEPVTEANAAAVSAARADFDALAAGSFDQDAAITALHTAELMLADTYLVTGTASLSTPRLRQSALLAAQVDRLHATAYSVLAIDLGLEAVPLEGFAGGNEVPSTFYL